MPLPLLAGVALQTAGRYVLTNGAKKGIQKYGPEVFKQIQKDVGLKTVGDKVIKKRMTAAQQKTMSKKIQKEDFPKQKPLNKMTEQEKYLEELDILSRNNMKNGGLLSDDRNMYKDGGGPGIEALREEAPKVVERMGYEEGGSLLSDDMPMEEQEAPMMPEAMPEMDTDSDMEENYTRFIMDEALSEEEEDMLVSKLEQDEELQMLFDKVIDVAQEFAGNGPVEGPGTGVSDDIPARLSDGEFVFTAKAVEEIGEDTLMSMMKDAEVAADERQGLFLGGTPDEEEIEDEESDVSNDMRKVNPRLNPNVR